MKNRDSVVIGRGIVVLLAAMLMASSCATHKDATLLRDDTALLRGEIASLRLATESRFQVLDQQLATLDSLLNEQRTIALSLRANLGSQSYDQRETLATITARQDEISYQLRELMKNLQTIQLYGGLEAPSATTQQVQTPTDSTGRVATADSTQKNPTGATPSLPPSGSRVKPEELYEAALDDFTRGRYPMAESRLLTFLVQFPSHESAMDAQYLLGETAMEQKKYDVAISEFDKLIKNFKKSPNIPTAMLKKGIAQTQLKQNKSAATTFKQLISSYPKSDEATQAKELTKGL